MKVTDEGNSLEMDYFHKTNTNYMDIIMQRQSMNIFSIFNYDKTILFNSLNTF